MRNLPQVDLAFRQLDNPDAVLLIAGLPNSATLRDEIESAAAVNSRVRCDLAFVPDDQVQVCICRLRTWWCCRIAIS